MSSDDPDLGAIIDERYQLVARIGQGGMGAVYKAIHVGMGREVAIKVLRPELGQHADALRRFEREAQATAKLSHKNLVAVSDFGMRSDGSLYLAMELLRGQSLGELLSHGPLPWPRAVAIARHVARGLAHAHGHGVIHRDIKPDNIFLVDDEDDPDFAKVLDFGIARSLDGTDATVTQAGLVVGTPAYLSPEQALGGALDGRSDIYGLAIVLYEMLTGQTPFSGREPIAMLTAHAVVEPPTFAEIAPTLVLPDGLEAIVRRGLAKAKEDRFDDAAALAAELDALRTPSSTWSTAEAAQLSQERPAVGAMTPQPALATVSLAAAPARAAATGMVGWLYETLPWLRDRSRRQRLGLILGGGVLAVGLVAAIAGVVGPSSSVERLGAPGHVAAPRDGDAGVAATEADAGKPALASAAAPAAGLEPLAAAVVAAADAPYDALVTALQDGKTCPARKTAVAKLRAHGDARAIGPLRKARYRMRGGFHGIGQSNSNSCLKAAADAAIVALTPQPAPR